MSEENTNYNVASFEVIGNTSTVQSPELPKNTPGESPIYPLYYYGDDYRSWIDGPDRFMLHDMDDPLNMSYFVRKYPDHGINFSELEMFDEYDDTKWVQPSISVVKFNKWSDEMKLYWLRNYQPELHTIYRDPIFKNCRIINSKAGVYEKYVIPFEDLING